MCINTNVAAIFMPNLDYVIFSVKGAATMLYNEFKLFTNRHHDVDISASF